MNLLLDTHTVIWFLNGDDRISKKAIQLIENPDSKNYVSSASIWEMTIKLSIGKLDIGGDLNDIRNQFIENSFELLPVSFENIITLYELPFHHRCSFDRLVISQAISHELTVISADINFQKYDVQLIW